MKTLQAIHILGISHPVTPRTLEQLAATERMGNALSSLDFQVVGFTPHQNAMETAKAICPNAHKVHVFGVNFLTSLKSYPTVVKDIGFQTVKLSTVILEQVGIIRREIMRNEGNGLFVLPLGIAYSVVLGMWNENSSGEPLKPGWWPLLAGDVAVLRFHEDGKIFGNELIKQPEHPPA